MNTAMKTMIGVVAAAIMAGLVMGYFFGPYRRTIQQARPDSDQSQDGTYQDSEALDSLEKRERPVIEVKKHTVLVNEEVPVTDFLERVTDADGRDLKGQIKAAGDQVKPGTDVFKASEPGIYFITYSVTDRFRLTQKRVATVLVNEPKRKGENA